MFQKCVKSSDPGRCQLSHLEFSWYLLGVSRHINGQYFTIKLLLTSVFDGLLQHMPPRLHLCTNQSRSVPTNWSNSTKHCNV